MTALKRDVSYNVLGWVLPALLGVASVPALTRILEPAQFGLLALGWAAVTAFAALDLGLGRATTFLVADRLARGADPEIPPILAAAGWSVWLLAAPFAVTGVVLAPWLAERAMDIPVALHDEATAVIRLLAVSLPFVLHGIILRSALEGAQRFGAVNAFRVPLGVVTWGGPWLATLWTTDVRVLVGVIVAGRVAYWLGQLLALPSAPTDSAPTVAERPAFGTLLRAGGWMTVSGVVSPIIQMADRALVPLVVPIATVGWYVAAGEGATKLLLFPAALQSVVFPALAAVGAAGVAHVHVVGWFMRRALVMTVAVLIVPTVVLFVAADPVMHWWLGASAVPDAALVFRLFLVAVLLNAMAQVPYSALQALGESRAAALLHLVELPVYIAVLVVATLQWGAVGAAAAWSARLVLDALLMWWLAFRRLPGARAMFNPAAPPA